MQAPQQVEAYISIGSNVGSRLSHLTFAVNQLATLSKKRVLCSALYETKPVGYTAQRDFLNMVVRIVTDQPATTLLQQLLDIEAERNRVRDIRFGPRTLDLDILLFGREYVCYNSLQIPHPRMWTRGFVIIPLADLAPDLRVPGGLLVTQLAELLNAEGDVRYVGRFW